MHSVVGAQTAEKRDEGKAVMVEGGRERERRTPAGLPNPVMLFPAPRGVDSCVAAAPESLLAACIVGDRWARSRSGAGFDQSRSQSRAHLALSTSHRAGSPDMKVIIKKSQTPFIRGSGRPGRHGRTLRVAMRSRMGQLVWSAASQSSCRMRSLMGQFIHISNSGACSSPKQTAVSHTSS